MYIITYTPSKIKDQPLKRQGEKDKGTGELSLKTLKGVSIRQIAWITGISKFIVEKA